MNACAGQTDRQTDDRQTTVYIDNRAGQTDRQTDDKQTTVYINNRIPAAYYR